MLSYESAVATELEGLSFTFLSSEEIRALSFSEIKNVARSGHESAGKSCIYDPSLGSTEIYKLCGSCNEMSNCDGHLGHIDFAIPLYHPMMMSSLCKLLKTVCLYCGRIKLKHSRIWNFTRLFEMCETEMMSEAIELDQMFNNNWEEHETKVDEVSKEHREKIIKLMLVKMRRRRLRLKKEGELRGEKKGVKMNHQLKLWNEIRNNFFTRGSKLEKCHHCDCKGKFLIKPSKDLSYIELSWTQSVQEPTIIKSYKEFVGKDSDEEDNGVKKEGEAQREEERVMEVVNVVNEEITACKLKSLNTTGKQVNKVNLHSYHLIPYLKRLFRRYYGVISHLFPQCRDQNYKIFFMECMGVSANRFRPPLVNVDKQIMLHSRSASLLEIVMSNEFIKLLLQFKYYNRKAEEREVKEEEKRKKGRTNLLEYLKKMNYQIEDKQLEQFDNYLREYKDVNEAISNQILVLQRKLSSYMDNKSPKPGIKQTLEHKTGTVRQNMLGKRVNYSARTVIAPDCFIDTNQMGMPLKFALELTVPEYVTKHNANFMRRLVINGPKVYPGAKLLRDVNGKLYNLGALSYNERVAKAKMLLVGLAEGNPPKIVYRHILDGDVVLLNRQPTLHKPGIMAHFVKVLTKQKIFRLNYVNCSTYNADFDGDEMNLHLPQDHLSQSEAQLIANADCQFVVPKNGQPIRGLIQDHCQGGALLTSRDTFFTKSEFFNLVHLSVNAFISAKSSIYLGHQEMQLVEEDVKLDGHLHQLAKRLKMLSDPFARRISSRNVRIQLETPAIIYPKKLYTGKQVVTCVLKTLIDNISLGLGDPDFQKKYRGINLVSRSQTPGDAWGGCYDGDKDESTIVIRNSELLQGVLDKSQFGASTHGLTHLIYELLGPRVCGMLLNSFSYLFTAYLQMRGATCSPRDFLLTEKAEEERMKILKRIKYTGLHLQELFMSLSRNTNNPYLTNGKNHIKVNGNNNGDNLKEREREDKDEDRDGDSKERGELRKLLGELVSETEEFYKEVKNQVRGVSEEEIRNCGTFSSFGRVVGKLVSPENQGVLESTGKEAFCRYLLKLGEKCSRVPKVKEVMLRCLANVEEESNLNKINLKFPTWLTECSEKMGKNGSRVERLEVKRGSSEEKSVEKMISVEENGTSKYRLGDSHTTCMRFYNMVCNSPRGNDLLSTFDRFFQSNIVGVSSDINELVDRTVVKFPKNGFATMVSTGAKGSKVNFAMISCALSQQTLEGKRVPVMPSVRTLPCFGFGDFGSRAGGFITDRFLTGLRPQEYFFHCMSGREGLVDTCVKTAKSGYLQRCVLKAMEDVIVCYDETVRDSNGNIIQFKYGEDGIDVSKSSYLTQLQDLEMNELYQLLRGSMKHNNNNNNNNSNNKSINNNNNGDYRMDVDDFEDNSNGMELDQLEENECGEETKQEYLIKRKIKEKFENYYNRCKCEAGDAVGCIAAQSIGEPATQMTLNTFHLAGHGATNVTLGIPRLVEILQNTSHSSTPYFSAKILGESEEEIAENAENATNALRKIYLSDVVHSVGVEGNVYVNGNGEKEWEYVATVQFEDITTFKKVIGEFETVEVLKFSANCLLNSFMKKVMGQLIVTMDLNVPFELVEKTDQLEEFWNMFVMQKQIVKRDKLSTRIRKLILSSGSSAHVPKTNDHDELIRITTQRRGGGDEEGEEDFREHEEEREQEYEEEDDEYEYEDEEDENEVDEEQEGYTTKKKKKRKSKSAVVETDEDNDSEEEGEGEDGEDGDDEEESLSESESESESGLTSSPSLSHSGPNDIEIDIKENYNEEDEKEEDHDRDHQDVELGGEDVKSPKVKRTKKNVRRSKVESKMSGFKFRNNNIRSINRKVFQFVKSLEFCRETSTLSLKFGWPLAKCPYFLELLPLLKQEISHQILRDSHGIKQSRIVCNTMNGTDEFTLHCDGTNLKRLFLLREEILDFNGVKLNDVATVLKYYGIEAARSCIVSELNKVFSVYGIKVNYRHLTLIADFMTQQGDIRTFTRYGMARHTSPLLQMSFESTMKFLMEASERGACDNLKSPAGALISGKPVFVGSSLCRLMQVVDLNARVQPYVSDFGDYRLQGY